MRSPSPTRFRFTNRLIEQLPPNPADAQSTEKEYSDADVSGLKCLVGKNGSKKFLLRYTWRGRKRSIALGAYGPLTVQDARGIANEYKGMLSRDEDPKQQKLRTQTAFTVEEFAVKHYLPHSASSKRSSRNDYSRFTHHVKPAIGSMLLDEVNIQTLQQFQNRLMAKLKPATNNRIMALVRHMFNMAVLWGSWKKVLSLDSSCLSKTTSVNAS
ncbi:integrase arm-type DNA-binding domain-containing protein [Pontibacterium sinense]|uniref:integrase arm-type DNA-binding domain-containing protein n=1 Tax=Pontibacterium sinense TaxID=2781979 RepID=UPI001D154AAB|nr:integrase arm-type DNA-binding domain-containing protein [Pontibacterium sinense]